MCRFAAYLGEPVLLEDLLYEPDGALVRQAVDAELMSLLNLGGFGLAAWDPDSPEPGVAVDLPRAVDPQLRPQPARARAQVQVSALVAHVRGVVYDTSETVGVQNVHPFLFEGASFALAQNGDLYDFARMRYDLLEHIDPRAARRIEGTTDTEWVYALMLSQLDGPVRAHRPRGRGASRPRRARDPPRSARARGIATQSPVNLVLTDGSWMLATRYAFDYGWYPEDGSFFAARARARLHHALVLDRRPVRPPRRRHLRYGARASRARPSSRASR